MGKMGKLQPAAKLVHRTRTLQAGPLAPRAAPGDSGKKRQLKQRLLAKELHRLLAEQADISGVQKQRDEEKRVAKLTEAKRESQRKMAEVKRLENAVAAKAMWQKIAEDDALMKAYSAYAAAKEKHELPPYVDLRRTSLPQQAQCSSHSEASFSGKSYYYELRAVAWEGAAAGLGKFIPIFLNCQLFSAPFRLLFFTMCFSYFISFIFILSSMHPCTSLCCRMCVGKLDYSWSIIIHSTVYHYDKSHRRGKERKQKNSWGYAVGKRRYVRGVLYGPCIHDTSDSPLTGANSLL